MQISVKTIRNLGYKKWMVEGNIISNRIRYLNTQIYPEGVKAWSCLSKFTVNACYDGLKGVLKYLSIDDINKYENEKKRAFKNFWVSIWDSYGEACGLDKSDIESLRSFGLKLELILMDGNCDLISDEDINILTKFYTGVLLWGVISSSEKSLLLCDDGLDYVLHLLVFKSEDEVINSLKGVLGV